MGTQRTKSAIDALFADNTSGAITPARLRDFVESVTCTSGSLYVTTPAATTIVTPGVYVKAAGTTTVVDSHRVSMPENYRLRYDGLARVHIHMVCNLSVKCASNNQILGFAFAKNGTVVDHSVMEHLLTTGTDIKVMAIHADMDLDTNDYVELWVTNQTSTGAVTIQRGYMYFMGMMCE